MALFTDAAVITVNDLLQFETSLVQIASSHGIDVDTKIGLATSGISDKLMLWLLNSGASDPQWLNRRVLGLSTVIVTPPLQRWLCFESLTRFFAEAYNVQLNTRFQAKWTEYKAQSTNASDLFFISGAAIVYDPLPKPNTPLVSLQTGTAPAQAISVQTAWVDARGEEGALSPVNGVVLPGNSSIVAGMAEGALDVPAAAAGWNIYASASGGDLTRQNSEPIPIGSTWELPASGLIAGMAAGNGQRPGFYISFSKQIRRG